MARGVAVRVTLGHAIEHVVLDVELDMDRADDRLQLLCPEGAGRLVIEQVDAAVIVAAGDRVVKSI